MHDPKTELQLIEQAKDGDKTAFELIVRQHAKRVYNIALRLCGNREDAEDISQDVFLKVYRNLQYFKGESTFSTFIYRVTVNCAVDHMRKRGRHKAESLDMEMDDGSVRFEPVSEEISPEQSALRSERKRKILEALNKLPSLQKQVIVLREFEDLSYEQIASVLDISIGTVKSRIVRGRAKLKEKLLCDGTLFEEYKSNFEEKEVDMDELQKI